MRFTYQARDPSGRIKSGEISAASRDEASRQLRQDGCYLLALEETRAMPTGAAGGAGGALRRRISRSEIIYFTNQMAIMVDAGVSLAAAIEGIARQAENPTLKQTLAAVQKDVEAGDNLSAALGKFPRQFDKTYINLVKASEASGTLAGMLDRIALQSRKELETRQKVTGALMYPAVMMLMCVGVSIFLLAYVFPKLTPMFAMRNLKLPGPTKLMIALSYALTHHWGWILLGVVLIIGGLVYARTQRWGRLAFDWLWLHLPILGPVCRKVALTRSMRTLATTINAGVPMLEAIGLSGEVANNVFFEDAWEDVSEKVAGGKQICEVLEGNRLFPATLVQMISSGESTGKLGQVLHKVSDYFDREVETAIKTATSLVEPMMVAVMGGIIGTIALAMLLPIFKLSTGH